jgi:hypothetical protein
LEERRNGNLKSYVKLCSDETCSKIELKKEEKLINAFEIKFLFEYIWQYCTPRKAM